MLEELGYQAGQHEILGEVFMVKIPEEIQEKTKAIAEITKKNMKDAKKLSEELDIMYKGVDKTKQKYQRSFLDWEDAKEEYLRASKDGLLSRKEISKLKSVSDSRQAQQEDYKGIYASQLMKTNSAQDQYYYKDLPVILNTLEKTEIDRINYVKVVLGQCVVAEKQAGGIIEKCRKDMETAINNIEPTHDSELVVESLKTGEVPPEHIAFDEIVTKADIKYSTLTKKKSKSRLTKQDEEEKFFPKKKGLEKEIEEIEIKIVKGNKEIAALQLMVQSYTNNPKFGDVTKFKSELETAVYNVQVLEADLHSKNNQLKELKGKFKDAPIVARDTSNISNLPENIPVVCSRSDSNSSSDRGSDISELESTSCKEEDSVKTVIALYPFEDDTIENSIGMKTDEEFIITEADDEGWTKVRRKYPVNGINNVGYVPTAYIQDPL